MASLMPSILVHTSAPIFNSLRRHALKAEGVIEALYAAYCRIKHELLAGVATSRGDFAGRTRRR